MTINVFVLGPSKWQGSPAFDAEHTPMDIRNLIKYRLQGLHINAILMEDEDDVDNETEIDKFHRLLKEHPMDAVLVYWPPGANTTSTCIELAWLAEHTLPTHMFVHPDVATIVQDDTEQGDTSTRINVTDDIGRSSYLGCLPEHMELIWHEWYNHNDLLNQVDDWVRAYFEPEDRGVTDNADVDWRPRDPTRDNGAKDDGTGTA